MADFIEFVLLGKDGVERKVKINKDDGNEVYVWKVCKKRPSYWKRGVNTESRGYYSIIVGQRHYRNNRVCFYAHNQLWDIYNNSRDNSIDHIDGNKKNNHISNLRQATNSQNQENRNVKGYSYHKTHKRWVAHLMKDGKTYHKYCKTEEEAILAREKLKAEHHTFI